MIGRRKLAVGVSAAALAGAALVPTVASGASASSNSVADEAATIAPRIAFAQQVVDRDGFGPEHGRGGPGRGFGIGGFHGGHGVLAQVLEDFGVSDEDARAAMLTVRESLADSRPDVERPLDDEDRAVLEAYAMATRAALADELGLDATAFEQAYQDAKAELEAEREARRTERLQFLADQLGVSVDALEQAFEALREQFAPETSTSTSSDSGA